MNDMKNVKAAQKLINQDAVQEAMNNVANPQVVKAMEQQSNQEVLSSMVDLKNLIDLGKVVDEKDFFGYKFALRTLGSEEITTVFSILDGLPEASDVTRYNVLMVQILARAIDTINGVPLENLYTNADMSPIERKLAIIKVWQQALVNELFKFYSSLADRGQKILADEKTEEQIKN